MATTSYASEGALEHQTESEISETKARPVEKEYIRGSLIGKCRSIAELARDPLAKGLPPRPATPPKSPRAEEAEEEEEEEDEDEVREMIREYSNRPKPKRY